MTSELLSTGHYLVRLDDFQARIEWSSDSVPLVGTPEIGVFPQKKPEQGALTIQEVEKSTGADDVEAGNTKSMVCIDCGAVPEMSTNGCAICEKNLCDECGRWCR